VATDADGVDLAGIEPLRFRTDARSVAATLRDRAAVAVACDSLGIAGAMLDATVAYVAIREQFGRPVGSFQAVKHACADMLVQVTVARALVRIAADEVAAGQPDAGAAVSRAKAYAGDAAVAVAGSAMQLHGGIGYTWESRIHAHLKRAMLDRSLFGAPALHRRRLVERHR
jgi:alkylation response protein AidB-like acyl-CoA dehydrogenase